MQQDFPFTLDNKELFSSMGEVVINICTLEDFLSTFITLLIDYENSHAAYIAVSEIGFRAKLGVLMSEYELRVKDPSKREKLRDLLEKCGDIEKTRNTYMHSIYHDMSDVYRGATRTKIQRFKPTNKVTKGFSNEPTLVTPRELNEFSLRIKGVGKQIFYICSEYLITLLPSDYNEKIQATKTDGQA